MTWNEVSKSTGAYTIASDEFAQFAKFGQDVLVALGHSDPLQTWTLGSSVAFADLGGSPPRSKYITIVEPGFVLLGNTWDSTDGSVENRVWWSAIDNAADWPTIGSADAAAKQSDRQDLPTGGKVQAVTGAIGGMAGAIFMGRAIYRMQYQGPPTVFGFYEVERDRGALAPYSVVNVGPFGFYLGEEGFYKFDGSGSTPIGSQRVDQTFYNDLDATYLDRVVGAADVSNRMVFWAYPGAENTSGTPNKIIVYNWAIDRWSIADIETEYLFRSLSEGYTLEELDSFGDLDSLPFSLDSRAWQGGSLVLSGFDTDNKLANFTGTPLAATIETPEMAIAEGAKRVFINGVMPLVDAPPSDLSVRVRYRQGNSPGSSLTSTTTNAIDADGFAHFTRSTRFASAEVDIAAGADWSHAQGVNYDAHPDGDI